jgi:hypothetical protein
MRETEKEGQRLIRPRLRQTHNTQHTTHTDTDPKASKEPPLNSPHQHPQGKSEEEGMSGTGRAQDERTLVGVETEAARPWWEDEEEERRREAEAEAEAEETTNGNEAGESHEEATNGEGRKATDPPPLSLVEGSGSGSAAVPVDLVNYARYVVVVDPSTRQAHSVSVRHVWATEGAEELFTFLGRNLHRRHKKHVHAWLCESIVWGRECALGRRCPNIHITEEGHQSRRAWERKAKEGKEEEGRRGDADGAVGLVVRMMMMEEEETAGEEEEEEESGEEESDVEFAFERRSLLSFPPAARVPFPCFVPPNDQPCAAEPVDKVGTVGVPPHGGGKAEGTTRWTHQPYSWSGCEGQGGHRGRLRSHNGVLWWADRPVDEVMDFSLPICGSSIRV